jgi:mannose/fructose/N-acetylgalactosamine-specific phosphotransferase system component IIB
MKIRITKRKITAFLNLDQTSMDAIKELVSLGWAINVQKV